jgi:hypothetical protein
VPSWTAPDNQGCIRKTKNPINSAITGKTILRGFTVDPSQPSLSLLRDFVSKNLHVMLKITRFAQGTEEGWELRPAD